MVSGLPRSGTSMIMRMLESGGLPLVTDGIRQADDDNPRGYYEYEPVKRLDKDASWLKDTYHKAIKIIYILLYHLPSNHRYKVIFLRRSLDEVVASQKVMLRNRQQQGRLDDEQLIESYHHQLNRLYTWIKHQPNFEIIYLDYEEVVSEPPKAVFDIVGFLGLPLDTGAMVSSVEPELYRRRSQALL
ncbi:MAG: sulfotransferase [Acidobacteriia bacterium]|nr:sulfotransferase [Terriglobia bacterium]